MGIAEKATMPVSAPAAEAWLRGARIFLALLLFATVPAVAQQNGSEPAQTRQPTEAPAVTGTLPAQQKPLAIPQPVKLDLLIRSTLMALNQANLSGNYTVLRDLGAPAFQRFYSAASLAEKFAGLRRAKIDFTPIFYFHPQLKQQAALQDGRFLRLVGFMPTRPQHIDFDLAYQNIEGEWLLVALSIGVSQAPAQISKNVPGAKPAAAAKRPDNAAPPAKAPKR